MVDGTGPAARPEQAIVGTTVPGVALLPPGSGRADSVRFRRNRHVAYRHPGDAAVATFAETVLVDGPGATRVGRRGREGQAGREIAGRVPQEPLVPRSGITPLRAGRTVQHRSPSREAIAMSTKLRLLSAILLAVPLLMGLGAGVATGAGAVTETQHVHGVTETFQEVNPCTGDPATITITYNGVFHITTAPNGSEHVTGTQTGTFTIVPDDSS